MRKLMSVTIMGAMMLTLVIGLYGGVVEEGESTVYVIGDTIYIDGYETLQNISNQIPNNSIFEFFTLNDTAITHYNLHINKTGTLKIYQGQTLKFDKGRNLYVDGILNATGGPTNIITFRSIESSPKPGDWGQIRFNGATASSSVLNNVNIFNGTIGVYCNNSSPKITNSIIAGNLQNGFYIKNSLPKISQNQIINNGDLGALDGGIYSDNAKLLVENCTLINSPDNDFFLSGSANVTTLNSTFNNNKVTVSGISQFTVKWYLEVLVKDNESGDPISEVVVNVENATGVPVENSPFTTGLSGYARWIKVIDYVQNASTGTVSYNPYTISLSHEEHYSNSTSLNIKSSMKTQINMDLIKRDLTTTPFDITFSPEGVPIAGEELTIRAKIYNVEVDDAQQVRVIIIDNAPEGPQEIYNSTIGEIKGNSYKNAIEIWNPTPGLHMIEIIIDPYDEIKETNSTTGPTGAENNNYASIDISVNARPIVNISEPVNNAEVNETIIIEGTSWDNPADNVVELPGNDVARIDISLDSYDWIELNPPFIFNVTSGGWDWSYDWDTTQWNGTSLSDGNYIIQARAWDNYHFSHLFEVNITINNTGANEAPVAVITEPENNDHFSANQSIKFNGSLSYDPNNDTLTYEWDFDDGNFASGNITYHSFNQKGTFNVKLTVNDSQVQNFTYVTVIIDNYPPYVELTTSATSVYVNQTITFYGYNSTDAETPVLTFLWDYDNTTDTNGDGNYTNDIDSMTITPIENTTHSYDQPGTYIVTLTVWDGRINGTDTVLVTILPNAAPNAVINNPDPLDTFSVNETIFFNASGSSDPNDEDLEYLWDFGDGTVTEWIDEPTTEYYYSELGHFPLLNYTVILRVRDDEGLGDSTFITIFVDNYPPVAIAKSNLTTAQTNQDINFDGTDSYDQPPGSTTLSFLWDFGDGNTSTVANTTHQFAQDGEYNVTLTVSDGMDANDTDWIIIIITNREPIIENVTITPQSPKMNEEITFTVTATDDDGEVAKYSWNFGDGNTYSENTTNAPDNVFDGITKHTYSVKDTYNVIVTVEDDDGAMDTYQFEVIVVNSPPEVIISSPTEGSTVSDIITISGTASDPDDGDTISEVYIKIDDGDWLSASGTTTWSYEWDTKMVFNGHRIIYARSYDGEDYSSEASRSVTVSNTPSSITVSINLNPGSIEAGGTVEVYGDVIYNTGEEVADAAINVTIIGEEGYWDATTDSMGEYSVEIMAPGEASTYTIRVIAEEETYSYQDTETSLLTVTAPPAMPDLEVTTADISFNPSAPDSGMNVQITITVRNIGDANANNFDVNAYLDQAGGTPIDSDTISVQADDQKNVIFNWATTGISGSHYIYVVLDPGDDIVESNENNNEASRPITVTGKPDYAVESSDISFSKPDPKAGETINILVVIHNEGAEGGIVTYEVYDGYPSDDNLIGDGQKSVSGDDEETVIVEWEIEGSGEHEIYVVLDPDDDVDEDDEDNNEASETITVEPGPGEGGIPGILLPLIVILAIVVIIILLFIYRREKGPKPSKELPLAQVVEKEVKTKTVKVEKDEEEEKSLLDGQGGVRI